MPSLKAKVEHVRAATQTRLHHCHWPGCKVQVPPAKWGCTRHWRMLPTNIQRGIWATYRIGQEVDQRPSDAYMAWARQAQEFARQCG